MQANASYCSLFYVFVVCKAHELSSRIHDIDMAELDEDEIREVCVQHTSLTAITSTSRPIFIYFSLTLYYTIFVSCYALRRDTYILDARLRVWLELFSSSGFVELEIWLDSY